MAKPKVTVVGAGFVGSTTAQRIVEKELADVVLVDIVDGLPQGKALDMAEAAPIEGYDAKITGSNTFEETAGSSLCVITAGLPRKPGMDRSELLAKNAAIVTDVVEKFMPGSPDAMLLVVSNPLDAMTYLAWRRSGLPPEKVFGMAGVLDTARFRTFLAWEVGTSVKDVEAMVLGGHGDQMVPLTRYATISGIPVESLIPADRLESIVERTRKGGGEIVKLLKQGSAYYAPSAAVTSMVKSILRDENRILPTCCWLAGQYGQESVYLGVPAQLDSSGVRKVIEFELSDDERTAIQASADHVREMLAELDA